MKLLISIICLLIFNSSSLQAAEKASQKFTPVKVQTFLGTDPRAIIRTMPLLYLNANTSESAQFTFDFLKLDKDTKVGSETLEQLVFLKYLETTDKKGLHTFVRCLSNEIVFENCESFTGIKRDQSFNKKKSTITKLVENQFMGNRKYAAHAHERPLVLVNGNPYQGVLYLPGILSVVNSFLPADRRIANVPVRSMVEFNVIANSDDQFGGRDLKKELSFLSNFPFVIFNQIDPNSSSGKALIHATKAEELPYYTVQKSTLENKMFADYLVKNKEAKLSGDNLVLNLSPESRVLIGRELKPNEVTLYVMSQCPYGVAAENGFIFAKENGLISKDLKLKVKFIVNKDKNGKLISLHGDEELAENYRQIAIQSKYPELYEKYLKLRNIEYKSTDWQSVATKVGIDVAVIEGEMKNAKKTLLTEDMVETAAFNISSSPTVLWENQTLLGQSSDFTRIGKFDPVAIADPQVQAQIINAKKQNTLKR